MGSWGWGRADRLARSFVARPGGGRGVQRTTRSPVSAPEQGWAPWDRQLVPTVPAPLPWAGTCEGCGPARTSWEPQQVSPAS